jgi:hypothetical protein
MALKSSSALETEKPALPGEHEATSHEDPENVGGGFFHASRASDKRNGHAVNE